MKLSELKAAHAKAVQEKHETFEIIISGVRCPFVTAYLGHLLSYIESNPDAGEDSEITCVAAPPEMRVH